MAIAYQYNSSGFYVGSVEDLGFLPNNSTYKAPPPVEQGFWPYFNGQKWSQVEDCRERQDKPELIARYGNHYPQKATVYWLQGDTHNSPPRTMKDPGSLPSGALFECPPMPFGEVKEAKYNEIIGGADAVKAFLSSRFSKIEEETWPQQEAGARIILGLEADCKDETARAIMGDSVAAARAVFIVEELAKADGTSKESFSERIIINSETAYLAGMKTLLEQRTLEAQLNAVTYDEAMNDAEKKAAIAKVETMAVVYSVMG